MNLNQFSKPSLLKEKVVTMGINPQFANHSAIDNFINAVCGHILTLNPSPEEYESLNIIENKNELRFMAHINNKQVEMIISLKDANNLDLQVNTEYHKDLNGQPQTKIKERITQALHIDPEKQTVSGIIEMFGMDNYQVEDRNSANAWASSKEEILFDASGEITSRKHITYAGSNKLSTTNSFDRITHFDTHQSGFEEQVVLMEKFNQNYATFNVYDSKGQKLGNQLMITTEQMASYNNGFIPQAFVFDSSEPSISE